MSDTFRTCPVLDELVDEDGAVVLQQDGSGHRVIRLSPLGQLIRELAVEGISLDVLVPALEARLGPPTQGNARDVTAQAVAAMEADGLLSRAPREHAHGRNESGDKT